MEIVQDVRMGLRMLGRRPGLTAVAVPTLALGLGITTAIFSLVQVVLLEPRPYEEPGGLVTLWEPRAG